MSTDRRVPEEADVVIVGGGINGISAFRELALQGLHVVLIERHDFCSGASAALSRMVHGGLRYLENGEFRLVREALRERDLLLRNAPHAVFPLPTIVPLTSWTRGTVATMAAVLGFGRRSGPRPGILVRLGLLFYDLMASGNRTLPRHSALSLRGLRALLPGVTADAVGGVLYFDARVALPERLGVEMILDVEAETASRAFNYVDLAGRDGPALRWRDERTGEEGTIRPRIVVNATGAWVDRVDALLRPGRNRRRVQGTKGSHLVIRNPDLERSLADRMLYYEHDDGRICIAFNHLGGTIVGSTDIRIDDPDEAVCLAEEKDYMLGALKRVLPGVAIEDAEIVHVFSGVRPLPVSGAGATARISRDHSVEEDDLGPGSPPVLTLVGGKWTTFRAFGAEVADIALRRLGVPRRVSTTALAIGGGRGFPADPVARRRWIEAGAAASGLPRPRYAALAARYGSRAGDAAAAIAAGPDRPLATAPDYSQAEIAWIVRHERVRDVSDLLFRRTSLGIEGRVTPALVAEAAPIVAEALGWNAEETQRSIARVRDTMARRHRVQENEGSLHVPIQEGPPQPPAQRRALP